MIITSLLLAGGEGSRLNSATPKQYIKLNNIPMICYSINRFLNNKKIDNIKIIISKKHIEYFNEINQLYLSKGIKLDKPIFGGKTRQESVYNGLKALNKNKPDFIIIHDCARPFLENKVLNSIIIKVKKNFGVVPYEPINDSLKEYSEVKKNYTFVDRKKIIKIQTPQIFCYKSLFDSYSNSININNFTDDSSIAESNNIPIKFIKGNENNFKITSSFDLIKAKTIMKKNTVQYRVGQGFDVHQFTSGEYIKLCGIKIPFSKSLLGNSDADVALHSLTDAILGSIGKGDIGEYFPDDTDVWKNKESSIFVKHALNQLKKMNGNIVNIDMTIICEKPKIQKYKNKMINKISKLTGLNITNINIKGTTTEGLGFLGRKEGVACQTIILINLK